MPDPAPPDLRACGALVLAPGREGSARRRHPWIFAGAVEEIEGDPQIGETVHVLAADRTRLGTASYSPHSQIIARFWTHGESEEFSEATIRARIAQAAELRKGISSRSDLGAFRLLNAESDGLPGIVVDRYADFLVCQFLTAGAEFVREAAARALTDLFPGIRGIYERSDAVVREKEGLPSRCGVITGVEPPSLVEFREGRCRFLADLAAGHKTGFYLDQRQNRAIVTEISAAREVLNCFSYTGAFGIAAALGGAARVTNIDTSAPALALAARHAELNSVAVERWECVEGDVFQILRKFRDARRRFDLVVLDPPKFADSKGQIEGACRGYKDINLLAIKCLREGGLLVTCSCSGLVSAEQFQRTIEYAAADSGRAVQMLQRLSHSPDHPVALQFPEGAYLKGFLLAVR